ncbi:MAG TPA: thioredoxin-like domain-containing protein, partial [Isosphaeraceae bacterium]|nr:thioredoxin-like domain-containing protein [Isosphaeraceae bacterium]
MRKPSPVSFRSLAVPVLILGVVLAVSWMASRSRDSGSPKPLQPVAFQGPQRIPGGLEGGVDWINTAGPIHLEDLKGKLVLLDFWTYCCINCHHILPDLEYLEKKYPNELVVIGVHTGKFPAEKDTDNIRKKVAEYKIQHPVINDANEVLWNRFFVSSWPTLVLLDANGNYVGSAPGEGNRDILDKTIGKLIDQHKARNEL